MPRNFFVDEDSYTAKLAASMRPRQMPRNFNSHSHALAACSLASMRPRQMPRNFIDRLGGLENAAVRLQ